MPIISLRNITISHSDTPLIENGNLIVNPKERVCIIGRNGAGKSTLLRLINQEITPDQGDLELSSGIIITQLEQNVPNHITGTVAEIVATGLSQATVEDWDTQHRIQKILSKLELVGDKSFNQLSGGLKRRVLLAKALLAEPDVLLLDEPTNHLDIDSIAWLEKFLLTYPKTLIFISHDRHLMQQVATHIVEIDHGQLFSWRGHYKDYLKHKESRLTSEAIANKQFDKKLAQEEAWIRQGIKARRTRNEGRVRALQRLRKERQQRRDRLGNVNLGQQEVLTSGKIVIEAKNINFQYNHTPIIKNFSTTIMRGDKIGIIGPNGVGKSTLINLLLKQVQPNAGNVKHGTNLTISYFDQHRQQLDLNKTIYDNVYEGSETLSINGKEKHIMSYLQDFLFSPAKIRTPLSALSGGERNRVLLAKLLAKPSNLLVLDEPTNDLDIETLELLEAYLVNYQGSIILVSHDREFLNNVVTSTLIMEGSGIIKEYVGSYDDWLKQKTVINNDDRKTKSTKTKPVKKPKASNKLSYNEKRELEHLPEKIALLESEQVNLQQQLSNPSFYKTNNEQVALTQQRLNELDQQIEQALQRWEALEHKQSN